MKDFKENIVKVISGFAIYEDYLKKQDNQTTIIDSDPSSAKKKLNFDDMEDQEMDN